MWLDAPRDGDALLPEAERNWPLPLCSLARSILATRTHLAPLGAKSTVQHRGMSSASNSAASSASSSREVGGSRRPDGTLRKTVKVRDGFKSEELDADRRAYKSKGQLQAEAQARTVVGLGPVGADPAEAAAFAKSNARALKRQRAKERKQAAWLAAGGVGAAPAGDDDEAEEDLAERLEQSALHDASAASTVPASAASSAAAAPAPAATAATADPAKQLKALHKKLRQMVQLEEEQAAGKILTTDQIDKLAKKPALQAEIAAMESGQS